MTTAGPASASPLLERERELDAFDRLVGDVSSGGSGLVVIEGSAGIGKSRLLSALRDRAADKGLRVGAAHGSELEREFAFGVVRQLFEPALAEPADRERLLAGGAAPARPVFELVASDGEDVSFAVLHGLYWLTVNLASERPLLLAVDELHWCDRPSLRFLAYLARRLEGLGAALAVGLRTAELDVAPVVIGELAEAPDAVRLRPGPLSEAGVAELIRSRLGVEPDRAFTAACVSGTGGNPLLLRQLLSSLEADGVTPEARQARVVQQAGPQAVSRTVLLRLHRLPDPAAAVAQAIAVLGDGAELPLVAALTALDDAAVAGATAALARAEILRPQPPLGFVHPLIRDAVYQQLPPGERELRHAEAARLVMQAGAPAEEVATHILACPRRGQDWVVDVLSEAARSARTRGAADSAATYLERALDEPPTARRRMRVVLELGLAETLTHGPAAAGHLREVWETLEDARERGRVAAALARTLIFTGPAAEGVAFVRRAAAELPAELVDERQALRAIELMAIPLGAADAETLATLEHVRIEGEGPGARMLAAAAAEGRALTGASADECVALATEALADGVLIDADPGFLRNAAPWVLVMADRDEAREAWEKMRAHAHRRGSLFGFLGTNLWTGASLLWWGDLPEAENTLMTALENAAAWGLLRSGAAYGPALAFTGAVRVLRGDLQGARRLLDPAEGDERRVESSRLTLSSRVELLLAEGRDEEALAAADELAERFGGIVNPGWAPWRSLKARALDRLGRSEEATALAGEELAHARRFGSPSVVGRSLRVLGTLERERGIDRLREAVELLERSTAKLQLGFALFALGAALRRLRKPSEAREPLRRALELADRCGAGPLAGQARAELYAAGGRPRRTALSGVESLTASERRVAELAAKGGTNKDIAQTLYVTLKTVERHLSSAYGKLGIRSRRELSQALPSRAEPPKS
ncbi:MAG TPA: AAA family ATPase [Thermoleophilaceae bacterium]|nr:AAA family ATPase [Thermoleophilaceae bacterium]